MIKRLAAAAARPALLLAGALSALVGQFSADSPAAAMPGRARESWLWTLATRWALRAIAVLTVLGAGGLLVMVAGIVPIKASSGHWAITAWFLNFAKSRSVATHTIGIEVPPLDAAALVLKGAGHYESACGPCHGSPSLEQPRIARQMTPTPPDLRESVRKFDPAELFYIVKHGIKLTGMPSWPAPERDDEVWAMVAFLRRLPGMDAREYHRLASGSASERARPPLERLLPPAELPAAITGNCSRCHGVDGLGRGAGAFPVLAGQRPEYLRASLEAYARRERHSGIMEPVAAALSAGQMQEIAEYYAGLAGAGAPSNAPGSGGDIERGKRIAYEGLPDKLVPACTSCHGPGRTRRNPHYPRLAGQDAEYIALQLSLFKARTRGGTAYHHIMERVASQLTDEDMQAVAAFFAALPATAEAAP